MLKQIIVHHRRGTVSLMFSIAAIPLIGMGGLGTEAASRYVIKRHSQNAADAAAYTEPLV